MSKTTKIIAALGVVAGLGVAALPAFTYATESVSGTADIYVEIPEAIAMTIVGNNDTTPQLHTTDPVTSGVDVYASGTATTGTVDGHTVSTVKTTSSSYLQMLQKAQDLTTLTSEIHVYTNSTSGYTLSALSSDNGALVNGSFSIASIAAADKGKAPAAGDGKWAMKVTGGTSASNADIDADYEDWNALPTTTGGVQIAHEDIPTSGGTQYDVVYGVGTASDQAAGLYKNTITYTATTK